MVWLRRGLKTYGLTMVRIPKNQTNIVKYMCNVFLQYDTCEIFIQQCAYQAPTSSGFSTLSRVGSGRNGFTRGGEHLDFWEACDEDKSVLWLHRF